MTKLEKLHKELTKENKRIYMLKSTISLDVDFMKSEIIKAKNKIVELQIEFNNEYEFQNI